jgi:DNA-binding NarL/FixJ family response regulator
VTKSERKDHLIDAIRAARTDTPYVGPRMALAMLNDSTAGRANLAPREKEVLIAWFRTESKDVVARQLQIAPTTVRTHLQRVRAKYAAVDARQRQRPPWSLAPFRTASSTSTASSQAAGLLSAVKSEAHDGC